MSPDIIYSAKAISASEQMYHQIMDILWSTDESQGARYDGGLDHGIRPLVSGTYLIKFRVTGSKQVEDEMLSLGAHIGEYEADKLLPAKQLYKLDATQTMYMKNKSDAYMYEHCCC